MQSGTQYIRPIVPLVPLVPQVPLTPTFPILPVTTTKPISPMVPIVPQSPTVPVTPTLPLVPITPTLPLVPITPTPPKVPLVPTTPTSSLTPTPPRVPLVPTSHILPLVPTTPTPPRVPLVPTSPTLPLVPMVPTPSMVPLVPVMPSKTPTFPTMVPFISMSVVPTVPTTPIMPVVPTAYTMPIVPTAYTMPVVPTTYTMPVVPTAYTMPTTPSTIPRLVTTIDLSSTPTVHPIAGVPSAHVDRIPQNLVTKVEIQPTFVPILERPAIITEIVKPVEKSKINEDLRKRLLLNENTSREYAISKGYLMSQDIKPNIFVDVSKIETPPVVGPLYDIEISPGKYKEYFQYLDRDMYLSPDSPTINYKSKRGADVKATAWGQRKLGITLIQFLTLYWNPLEVSNPIVIYAGAAVGKNIAMAIMLFPEFEWHLYDPHDFELDISAIIDLMKERDPKLDEVNARLKLQNKVKIFTGTVGWFTDEVAKSYAKTHAGRIFFLSDIRSVTLEVTPDEFERGVWRDMTAQSNWHKIMKPVKSQLKFRLPYTTSSGDLIGDDRRVIKYLKGTVFKQPYAKPTSTETRLVPDDDTSEVDWNFKIYESAMFYHNTVMRTMFTYLNPLFKPMSPESMKPVYPPELLNDYDSMTETYIWILYLRKRGQEAKINTETIASLNRRLTTLINWGNPKGKTMADLRKL